MAPKRALWVALVGGLGLLAVVPASQEISEQGGETTGWNSYAVLSPIEGVLAALAVLLVVSVLWSRRVPTSVGAGALLVIGASSTIGAIGLTTFADDNVSSAVPLAVVVLVGAVLTLVAGVDALRAALPAPKVEAAGNGPLVLGGAGVFASAVALFVTYDGKSSLKTELDEGTAEYFYGAGFDCLLALCALLALRAWPRLAAGALLAAGGVLAVHHLGIVFASKYAIGTPGNTGNAGYIGILGGLLVAAAGAYAYAVTRPRNPTGT